MSGALPSGETAEVEGRMRCDRDVYPKRGEEPPCYKRKCSNCIYCVTCANCPNKPSEYVPESELAGLTELRAKWAIDP